MALRAIETTAYSCCAECLKNAAQHAGKEVSATVHIREADGGASFTVEDDGAEFDPGTVERGNSLTNLADRVATVGGTLTLDSASGQGTSVAAGPLPLLMAAASGD